MAGSTSMTFKHDTLVLTRAAVSALEARVNG